MTEPKLEVLAELRDLAEKTIDQAEKAFGMFFDAAGKSMTSMPARGTGISRQALSFTEQNMRPRSSTPELVHATDLQEAMRIQSEFLRSQFTNAGEHMRQITGGVMSAAKDSRKASSEAWLTSPRRPRPRTERRRTGCASGACPGDGADGRERLSRLSRGS